MRDIADEAISVSKADLLEIRLEDTRRVEVFFSEKDLKKAREARDDSGHGRGLLDGSWGFVGFSRPEELEE